MTEPTSQETSSPLDDAAIELNTSRRAVLGAAGVVGAAGFLAACSGGGSTASSTATDPVTDEPTGSTALAKTSDVPEGGALFVDSEGVVVAQPSAGEFKAFDARCPHQGCMVSNTVDTELLCPCHGSRFSSETGAVLRGPAQSGLPEIAVQVKGDDIVRA